MIMKTRIKGLLVLLTLSAAAVTAQTVKRDTFKVAGNCSMCETRIEKAATSLEGVSSAAWDKETKMIGVSFEPGKVDIHRVHMAIAKSGHDTEVHRASDQSYNLLPGCCKYERLEYASNQGGQQGHQEASEHPEADK